MRRRAHHATLFHHLLLLVVIPSRGPAAAATRGGAVAAGTPDGLPSEHLFPCLDEVLPCTAYLNATANKHPSSTCCTAMHRATAAGEMPCMCRLLADPELLTTFNVTTYETFRLPARCTLPVGCRAGVDHEPVVEAPPPPPPAHQHHHYGSAASRDWSGHSVWLGIVLAMLGGTVPVAVVF